MTDKTDKAPKDPSAKEVLVQPITETLSDPFKQQELVDKLIKKFAYWDSWRKPFENSWNRIYKLYFSQGEEAKTSTRAKIFIPVVFQAIEAAIPKIMNVIFGSDEFFDVVATKKADIPAAQVIKLLLVYQLGKADFFLKFLDFAKQLLLYGTSYFKVYWIVTRKWAWERKPIREDVSILGFKLGTRITGWEESKQYKVTERRPEIDVLDILDVFPDPEAANEREGSGVFIRTWMDYNDLKDLSGGQFPVYANIPDKSQVGGTQLEWNVSRSVRQGVRFSGSANSADSSMCEVLEYWGLEDLDDDGIKEECYIAILDRKFLIHADGNPFHHQKRPLVRSTMYNVPREWYGIGLIEPVIPLVHELNTLRRQRLDNINLAINNMWSINSYADIDLSTLVSTAGGIILRGDNPDDVIAMPKNDVTQSAYQEASIVQNDIETTTAPKSISGTQENGNLGRTAKGAQLIIGQALEKFGLTVRMTEETGIKPVLRMCHQLNLQFIDDDDVFTDTGMYGGIFDQSVTPEMIRAEVKFNMLGINEMVNKESKINQVMSFMGIFGKALTPDSIGSAAKMVWKLMGFNEDDITIQGMQPLPEPQGAPNPQQAIQAQVAQQGAAAPAAIPGVNSRQ